MPAQAVAGTDENQEECFPEGVRRSAWVRHSLLREAAQSLPVIRRTLDLSQAAPDSTSFKHPQLSSCVWYTVVTTQWELQCRMALCVLLSGIDTRYLVPVTTQLMSRQCCCDVRHPLRDKGRKRGVAGIATFCSFSDCTRALPVM